MKADFRIFLDACVLANFQVCDLLLRLSERPRLIVPCWTEQILQEVHRTHLHKLKWSENLAETYQNEIRQAFPQSIIEGYEDIIPALRNDEKDRHVLAGAIRGHCPLIITFNLRHFPSETLLPWSIRASHPQDYLLILYEMEPKQVIGCLGEIAGRRQLELEDVLLRLGRVLPAFSSRLLDDLEN